ncbi:hypothetical protein [Nocardioides sp.]|uniref:hypothetical protein n=1 Tax=Nocardioides sp. TaxID=35761 RepID=UPI0035117B2D
MTTQPARTRLRSAVAAVAVALPLLAACSDTAREVTCSEFLAQAPTQRLATLDDIAEDLQDEARKAWEALDDDARAAAVKADVTRCRAATDDPALADLQ